MKKMIFLAVFALCSLFVTANAGITAYAKWNRNFDWEYIDSTNRNWNWDYAVHGNLFAPRSWQAPHIDSGKFGLALNCSNTNPSIPTLVTYPGNVTGDSRRVLNSNEGTIEFFFKPFWNSGDPNRRIILQAGYNSSDSWAWNLILEHLYDGGWHNRAIWYGIGDPEVEFYKVNYDSANLVENSWNHFAVVWSTSELRLYLNGQLEGVAPVGAYGHIKFGSNTFIRIGGSAWSNNSQRSAANGSYDALAIYNHAVYSGSSFVVPTREVPGAVPINCDEVALYGYGLTGLGETVGEFVESHDCTVNLRDYAVIANEWLNCNDPCEN